MREKIFNLINQSKVYSIIYGITLLVSLFPLMYQNKINFFFDLEVISIIFFIIDYILRFLCSDLLLKRGKLSFYIYPFTPFALIDLLSILPIFLEVFTIFVPMRVIRLIKLLRVFKILRYNKEVNLLIEVFKRDRKILKAIFLFALIYIFIMALIVFQVEPQTFKTFFDALYWSCVSLTTVGYGDIYAISYVGKIISMVSSLVGVGTIALPSGIIAGTFVQLFKEQNEDNKDNKK